MSQTKMSLSDQLMAVLETYRQLSLSVVNGCTCDHRNSCSSSDGQVFHQLIRLERQYRETRDPAMVATTGQPIVISGVASGRDQLVDILENHRRLSLQVVDECRCGQRSTDSFARIIQCEKDYRLVRDQLDATTAADSNPLAITTDVAVDQELANNLMDTSSAGPVTAEVDNELDVKSSKIVDNKTMDAKTLDIKSMDTKSLPIGDYKCLKSDIKFDRKFDVKLDIKKDIKNDIKIDSKKWCPKSDNKLVESCLPQEPQPQQMVIDLADDANEPDLPSMIGTNQKILSVRTKDYIMLFQLGPQTSGDNSNTNSDMNGNQSKNRLVVTTKTNDNSNGNSNTETIPSAPVLAKPAIKCPKCDKTFKLKLQLLSHDYKVHNKRFQCPDCDFKTNKNSHLNRHIETHLNKPMATKKSSTKTKSTGKTSSKSKSKTAKPLTNTSHSMAQNGRPATEDPYLTDRPFVCHTNGCGASFKTRDQLKCHKNSGHHLRLRRFGCVEPDCDKRFYSNKSLKEHLKLHSTQRIPCSECPKSFKTKKVLLKHIQTSHVVLDYECNECDFKTHAKYELLRHQRLVHLSVDVLDFKCLVNGCTKVFVKQSELIQHKNDVHLAMASDGSKYPCDWPQCHRRYVSAVHLERHKRLHSFGKIQSKRMRAPPPAVSVPSPVYEEIDPFMNDNNQDSDEHYLDDNVVDLDDDSDDDSDEELEVVYESLANKQ